MRKSVLLAMGLLAGLSASGQETAQRSGLLSRQYRDGEKLTYRMTGIDRGLAYEIQATGVVGRDSSGRYIEEYAWSNFVRNGAPAVLPPATSAFRQVLSLDPGHIPSLPNLAQAPQLIGPITDLLTFYADLWLTIRAPNLKQAGDRFFQEGNMAASWADGTNVILGESAVDFDITLTTIDRQNQTATLLVRHVPPKKLRVKLPVAWMAEPVADAQNNWVSVRRGPDKYTAASGKETFDVLMNIRLADGVILSGTLDNVVETRERECADAALTDCGESRPRRIVRQIQITLDR